MKPIISNQSRRLSPCLPALFLERLICSAGIAAPGAHHLVLLLMSVMESCTVRTLSTVFASCAVPVQLRWVRVCASALEDCCPPVVLELGSFLKFHCFKPAPALISKPKRIIGRIRIFAITSLQRSQKFRQRRGDPSRRFSAAPVGSALLEGFSGKSRF